MYKINKGLIVCLSLLAVIACERDLGDEITYNDSEDKNSEYYDNTEDYEWDLSEACSIVLMGDEVSISGTGATCEDDRVLITEEGQYHITGELTDGQIAVEAGDSARVKLILDNATVSCSDNSPVFVSSSERTIIILADGSDNLVSDGSSYSSDESNATIYSRSDLVLAGEGTLEVRATYNDGITSKDGMIIHSGNFKITATDDGIRGKDYLVIQDGTFDISSGGDAILSDNEDEDYGYVDIYKGSYKLSSAGDGIFAYSELYLEEGDYAISCSDGYNSGKALKAGSLVRIAGGDYTLESIDDAVHSDQDILVESGNFSITTNDDGFHAENELTIEYADILISDSYEGLEAKTMVIEDGNIEIHSSDDGINTASGSASSMGGIQPGSSGNNYLKIEGGYVVVYASGDGLDINGSAEMSGGTVLVHGPTSSGNGALDYDGSFIISGGTLVAAGSSGMAMAPSSSSSQYSVLVYFSSTNSAGTLFHMEDGSGTTIASFRPEKQYQSVAVSSPELAGGVSYNIYLGGSDDGQENGGLIQKGTYTPGTLYQSFTLTSTTTTVGSSSSGGGGRH